MYLAVLALGLLALAAPEAPAAPVGRPSLACESGHAKASLCGNSASKRRKQAQRKGSKP